MFFPSRASTSNISQTLHLYDNHALFFY